MKWISHITLLLTLSFSHGAFAKRFLFASQFSLIPESEAHVTIGQAYEAELNPDSIKVMTWNMKKAQERYWDRDFPIFAQNKDLLILQETYLNNMMLDAFDSLDHFQWDVGISFLYKKDNDTPTGTTIGSTVSPTFTEVRHTEDYEPIIKTPKALTIGKYPIAGMQEELLVISIHAINIVSKKVFSRQIKQALEYIDNHEGPVIFAGDFNTNIEAKTKYLFKEMYNRGFQSVDFRNDRRMKFKLTGEILDHTFIRGMHVVDAYVKGDIVSSDHKPMFVELKVNDR